MSEEKEDNSSSSMDMEDFFFSSSAVAVHPTDLRTAANAEENNDNDEDENVFEIIEEFSDDEEEKKEQEEDHSNSSGTADFSLSSIKFVLGDAWQGSVEKIGTAAESLVAHTSHVLEHHHHNSNSSHHGSSNSSSSGSNNNSSHNSNNKTKAKSFVVASLDGFRTGNNTEGGKPQPRRSSCIALGRFEDRVRRLQYSNEDVAEIVEDPNQFEDLRLALREMGAMTNTTLKQRLHWYIRNSKREKERLQKEQQQLEEQQQQQIEVYPETPTTETQMVDTTKVMDSCAASSPNSVRGIYVPQTLSS